MIEETLISAISVVGFPIVAFCMMYKLCSDTIQKNTDALADLREAFIEHKN